MRDLLRRMQPTEFNDIVAVLALYRPGPMGMNAHNDYADRKNGRQPVKPIHPELEEPLKEILAETYGLIVYQEQIMFIAQKVASYTMGKADALRKAMGKKKLEVLEAEYKGFYSTRQEQFLQDKDRNPDGSWAEIYGEVKEIVEQNWYFRMGKHQQWLIEYLETHPEFVQPDYRRNEVLGFLKNHTLEDLCISRPSARLSWGIPLPNDPAHVVYVWIDALLNYYTAPLAALQAHATRLVASTKEAEQRLGAEILVGISRGSSNVSQ